MSSGTMIATWPRPKYRGMIQNQATQSLQPPPVDYQVNGAASALVFAGWVNDQQVLITPHSAWLGHQRDIVWQVQTTKGNYLGLLVNSTGEQEWQHGHPTHIDTDSAQASFAIARVSFVPVIPMSDREACLLPDQNFQIRRRQPHAALIDTVDITARCPHELHRSMIIKMTTVVQSAENNLISEELAWERVVTEDISWPVHHSDFCRVMVMTGWRRQKGNRRRYYWRMAVSSS